MAGCGKVFNFCFLSVLGDPCNFYFEAADWIGDLLLERAVIGLVEGFWLFYTMLRLSYEKDFCEDNLLIDFAKGLGWGFSSIDCFFFNRSLTAVLNLTSFRSALLLLWLYSVPGY